METPPRAGMQMRRENKRAACMQWHIQWPRTQVWQHSIAQSLARLLYREYFVSRRYRHRSSERVFRCVRKGVFCTTLTFNSSRAHVPRYYYRHGHVWLAAVFSAAMDRIISELNDLRSLLFQDDTHWTIYYCEPTGFVRGNSYILLLQDELYTGSYVSLYQSC